MVLDNCTLLSFMLAFCQQKHFLFQIFVLLLEIIHVATLHLKVFLSYSQCYLSLFFAENFNLLICVNPLSVFFLIAQQILFAEFRLYQHLILPLYLSRLLLVYDDFLCIHNLTNFLQYSLHLGLSFTYLFLCISLYQTQWDGLVIEVFSINHDIVVLDNTFQ